MPGVEEDLEGTPDEPAARVKVYLLHPETGKFHPTSKHVARACRDLTRIEHPMAEVSEEIPYPAAKGPTPAVTKGAVPFRAGPVDDSPWDAAAARAQLARWASRDGSGDKDSIDWSRYEQGFAWCDPDRREEFGGYKLPHHTVEDGTLHVSRRGVEAAYAALRGARGGPGPIPPSDRPDVRSHLARHYAQWGAAPGQDGRSLVLPPHRTLAQVEAEMIQQLDRRVDLDALAERAVQAALDRARGVV